MYWYVLSTYQYILFLLIWYCISFVSAGYIRAHTEDFWVHTLQFMRILRACRALLVCLHAIHALECAFNQSTLHKVYKLLLVRTLASACQCTTSRLGTCAGLLGDAAAAGQLCLHDSPSSTSEMMISSLLTSSASPSQWCIARGEWAFEGLGVQVVVLMISSNWNVKDVTTKYRSNPARFRDLIREIKQRADLGWIWAVHMAIGTWRSDWNVEDVTANDSSTPAKFRILIREIKQRADLGWGWAVQLVIETSRSDWNVEDVTANNSSTRAKFKVSSMM